jgi:hypothetical protein
MSAQPPPLPIEDVVQDQLEVAQKAGVPGVREPQTLLPCREVTNWCSRVLAMKPPVISEENWAGVFLGACVGLAIYWASGDFTNHASRHGAVITGTVLCGVLTLAFASLAWKRRDSEQGDAKMLADEMATARDANSVGAIAK